MYIVNIDMRWLALYHPVCYRVLIPLCISLVYLYISKKISPATSGHILKVGYHGNISHYNKQRKKLKADILLA